MQVTRNVLAKYGQRLVPLALALPFAAMAQVDTSDAEAAIADAGTAVGVIGAAVFIVIVAAAVWKWLRRSL
jgi:hypothetical protein